MILVSFIRSRDACLLPPGVLPAERRLQ